MFSETLDTTTLRQGDIVAGLYCPVVKCKTLPIIGEAIYSAGAENVQPSFSPAVKKALGYELITAQVEATRGFCIVLSQNCDLIRRNNGQLDPPGFVVAPLAEVPQHIQNSPQNLEKLLQNTAADYTNLFHLPQQSPLAHPCVVNFNLLCTIHFKEYDYALSLKVLELTDQARVKLKYKLGLHFGRPTQEEIDAGIYPP